MSHSVYVCVCVSECVCVHVCVCVCVGIRRKNPIKDFCYLHIRILVIYVHNQLNFYHVGLSVCFYVRR